MFGSKLTFGFLVLSAAFMELAAREIILEFKGAYYRATHCPFKQIFHKGGALFGPELTVQLSTCHNWYGFASVDYLSKKGTSIGLCNETKVHLVPLAFGLKYFMPIFFHDFYVGLGFQPTHVKTFDCSPYVARHTSQWCFGGIAKFGTYIDLPCTHWVLDLFVDYSFVKTRCPKICLPSTGPVVPIKTNISGVIFGAGIGYCFD